jgi:hypothetical protein
MAAPSRSVGPRPIARQSWPRDGAAFGVSADPGDGRCRGSSWDGHSDTCDRLATWRAVVQANGTRAPKVLRGIVTD